MIVSLTLLASTLFMAASSEMFPREAVDLTIEAGNLVGTGVIEFKSLIQSTEVAAVTAPTLGHTSCFSAGPYEASHPTVTLPEETSYLSTSLTFTPSPPFPLVPTTHRYFPNGSVGPTSTPTNTIPVVSGAIALRHVSYSSFFILVATGFYVLIF